MQTLIDPFELASRTLPQPGQRPRDVATSLLDIDVQLEEDTSPPPRSPSPDSSSRLRCWCSED
jgi:hypothetical protein